MEHENEYDPISGIDVEICRVCEELNKNFREQAAYLRRYDDLFGSHDGDDYYEVRRRLTGARDLVAEALTQHQRQHASEV
jgi:hypothetical protein